MKKFIAVFKDKRVRYGSFSTVMMLAAVAIFVFANLLADEFDRSFDLTVDRLFTLSHQSIDFLETLDTDVTIYHIARTGEVDPFIGQILSEFENFPHITVQFRDPMINPAFTMQFSAGAEEGIPIASMIVQSGDMYRVILPQSLLTMRFNPQTWQNETVSINVEREISHAIYFVTQTVPTIVYNIIGSEEIELSPSFIAHLAENNFIVRTVNAMFYDIPDDAEIIILTAPSRDWTELKAERISNFLHNEGRALMAFMQYDDFPNMNAVLADFGVIMGDYIIFEANPAFAFRNEIELVPAFTEHEIVDALRERNARNLVILGSGIEPVPHSRVSLRIEPLMHTSTASFGRWDPTIETRAQHPNDIDGPFSVAVAITDSWFVQRTHTIQIVVLGSVFMLDETVNTAVGGNNWAFITNSLNWLADQPPGIFVQGRTPPGVSPLVMMQSQANLVALLAFTILPLTSLGAGIFVWFRRRYN